MGKPREDDSGDGNRYRGHRILRTHKGVHRRAGGGEKKNDFFLRQGRL